jgi:penicillin amidase
MKRWSMWLKRGMWVAMGVVVLLAIAGMVYRQRVLPVDEGSLAVAGLEGEVSITRDAYGIPSIRAASTNAAVFGLGFVHAQDRLWQLDTHRRIGSGRLAEGFGPAALENDKFFRALGVKRAAVRQWQQLDAESRRVIEAYTAGINAFSAQHLRARPPEFVILGLDAEPWIPEDTLAWSIMMAWDLGGNWSNELLRMRLTLTLPGDDIVARINGGSGFVAVPASGQTDASAGC